ncbi:MAG: SPFH domain-containing protein [Bacteroidota bacterium]
MLGFKYIRFDSMAYVIRYRNGKRIQEGRGLAFWYFAPRSSIVSIPTGSRDLPFIFTENTQDFQTVTIQGQITYRVSEPQQLADMLDFTVDANKTYLSDDPDKLAQRIINEAQTATSAFVHSLVLKNSLRNLEEIEERIRRGLIDSHAVNMLGVEILGVHVLAVRPTAEMARALEAETREALQQEADQAVYERRNFAVEQERMIRESELNTEIAVEEKQKQISEKRMETAVVQQDNERKIRQMEMETQIGLEKQRREYIELQADNERTHADTKQYALQALLEPYKEMDWKKLMAIQSNDMDPGNHIALAFRELAENASKIESINISPELLNSILRKKR